MVDSGGNGDGKRGDYDHGGTDPVVDTEDRKSGGEIGGGAAMANGRWRWKQRCSPRNSTATER